MTTQSVLAPNHSDKPVLQKMKTLKIHQEVLKRILTILWEKSMQRSRSAQRMLRLG